jgi:hypothetical protein
VRRSSAKAGKNRRSIADEDIPKAQGESEKARQKREEEVKGRPVSESEPVYDVR